MKKEASVEDTEVGEDLMEAPEADSEDETMQEASPKEESEALAAHLEEEIEDIVEVSEVAIANQVRARTQFEEEGAL